MCLPESVLMSDMLQVAAPPEATGLSHFWLESFGHERDGVLVLSVDLLPFVRPLAVVVSDGGGVASLPHLLL